jgi:hypothetical protein
MFLMASTNDTTSLEAIVDSIDQRLAEASAEIEKLNDVRAALTGHVTPPKPKRTRKAKPVTEQAS